MTIFRAVTLTLAWAVSIAGCNTSQGYSSSGLETGYELRIDNPQLPKKIMFVVAAGERAPLLERGADDDSSGGKLEARWRQYAAEKLKERGLCAKGFVGPDAVFGYRGGSSTKTFFVTRI